MTYDIYRLFSIRLSCEVNASENCWMHNRKDDYQKKTTHRPRIAERPWSKAKILWVDKRRARTVWFIEVICKWTTDNSFNNRTTDAIPTVSVTLSDQQPNAEYASTYAWETHAWETHAERWGNRLIWCCECLATLVECVCNIHRWHLFVVSKPSYVRSRF